MTGSRQSRDRTELLAGRRLTGSHANAGSRSGTISMSLREVAAEFAKLRERMARQERMSDARSWRPIIDSTIAAMIDLRGLAGVRGAGLLAPGATADHAAARIVVGRRAVRRRARRAETAPARRRGSAHCRRCHA